jgi:acyl-CoA reductase-like NAD-dependent aldehyde dehydrogenase
VNVSTLSIVNPATEDVVAELPIAGAAEVDAAVARATEAQRRWKALPASRRGELLWRWADLVEKHAEEVGRLDSLCMGKPLADAIAEAKSTAGKARYWAGMTDKILGSQVPVAPGYLSYTSREPLGVIAVIIPWNGPTSSFVGRVSFALACGNSVVVKPSELGPLSAPRLAELATEAGIPDGVITVLTGDGATGTLLTTHRGVHGVAFTGSVATGQAIATAAARTFKSLVLELGGKSPNIVFDDADLDKAVRGSLWGIFYNTGQVCCAGTRLLVQRSIAEEFTERLVRLSAKVRTGDPLTPGVHMGPVVSRKQYNRVRSYIDIGKGEGAQLLLGGDRPEGLGDKGFYVGPTIFSEVDPAMRIASEEIFGPVLSILTFEDEAEALALANDTDFGLSANIWSRDSARLIRMAEGVEAGTVWCNSMRLFHAGLPFGGAKDSGIGNSAGIEAVEGLTRVKRVSILYGEQVQGPSWPDLEREEAA